MGNIQQSKQTIERHNWRAWFVVVLLVLIVISLIISFATEGKLSELFINLSSGFIASLITAIVLEKILVLQFQKEVIDAIETTREETKKLRNMMVMYFSPPLGIDVTEYLRNCTIDSKTINSAVDLAIHNTISIDFQKKLATLTVSEWRRFREVIKDVRAGFVEYNLYYARFLPKFLLGKIIKVYSDLSNLQRMFEILPGLFVNEKNGWPTSKNGPAFVEALRKNLIVTIARELKTYLVAANDFYENSVSWIEKPS